MNHKTLSSDEILKRLQEGLDVLNLSELGKSLENSLAQPVEIGKGRLAWLWTLIEPQMKLRVERRVERRVKESRLPERKTFEAFDFSFQPELDKDSVLALSTLRFIKQGKNILLAGMSGTGKSHIAKALALLACNNNKRVRYTTSADLLMTLNASLADDSLAHVLKRYTRVDLLVIDEIGLEQVERQIASRSGLLQKVLLPRYDNRLSTIITSNIPWDAWGEYLDDQLGATAIVDRLLHHSHVIVINGPSYRDYIHRRELDTPTD